jgi:hypothetical protein
VRVGLATKTSEALHILKKIQINTVNTNKNNKFSITQIFWKNYRLQNWRIILKQYTWKNITNFTTSVYNNWVCASDINILNMTGILQHQNINTIVLQGTNTSHRFRGASPSAPLLSASGFSSCLPPHQLLFSVPLAFPLAPAPGTSLSWFLHHLLDAFQLVFQFLGACLGLLRFLSLPVWSLVNKIK